MGRTETIIDPLNNQVIYGYDYNDNLLSISKTPNGGTARTTSFGYNEIDQRITETTPLSDSQNFAYDVFGNLRKEVDASANSVSKSYDKLNRVDGQTDSSVPPVALDYGYDALGNLETQSIGLGTTSFEYDPLNRLQKLTDASGNVSTYVFASSQNKKTITEPSGATTVILYDELGRAETLTKTSTNPDGTTTVKTEVREYYPDGNLKSVTLNETGKTQERIDFTYDELDRVISETSTKNGQTAVKKFKYDDNNNLVAVWFKDDSGSAKTTYGYDALNRVTSETVTSSINPTPVTKTYRYDDAQNTVTSDALGTFTYDQSERLDSITSARGTFDYGYAQNKLRSLKVPGTETVIDYNNDKIKGLTVWQGAANTGTKIINEEYQYNSSNKLTNLLVNGAVTKTYDYYPTGQVKSLNGTEIYEFDGNGNLKKITDTASGIVFDFIFDTGNQLEKQIISLNGSTLKEITYLYDTNGNLIKATETDNQTNTTVTDYAYNGRNQLTG